MNSFIERQKDWLNGFTEKKKRNYQSTSDCVVFVPVKCPLCGSKNIHCYGRSDIVRYHECQDCKKKFKSVEK